MSPIEPLITIILTAIVLCTPTLSRVYFRVQEKTDTTVSKREPFFDILRGLAILAVILIHVRRLFEFNLPENNLYFLHATNNFSRFAIAFFLICSGVLLNPQSAVRGRLKEFFSKKFVRAGIPYIFMTTLLAYYGGVLDRLPEYLISGRASTPYYFIIILFQCYLLYPVLVKFSNYRKELLVSSFFISLVSLLHPDSWHWGIFPMATKFLFFFVYGFVKRDEFLNFTPHITHLRVWLFILLSYSSLILAQPALLYNVRLFYGIAVFNLLFFTAPILKHFKKTYAALAWLGKNSLWIYLLHFLILEYIFFTTLPVTRYYTHFFGIFIVTTIVSALTAKLFDIGYKKILQAARL